MEGTYYCVGHNLSPLKGQVNYRMCPFGPQAPTTLYSCQEGQFRDVTWPFYKSFFASRQHYLRPLLLFSSYSNSTWWRKNKTILMLQALHLLFSKIRVYVFWKFINEQKMQKARSFFSKSIKILSKILKNLLPFFVTSKQSRVFFQIFVAFSECLNFKS